MSVPSQPNRGLSTVIGLVLCFIFCLPISAQGLFSPNSDAITHPYFSEFRPGFEKTLNGRGSEQGVIWIQRVERSETYGGVRCLVVYEIEFENGEVEEFQWLWLAQDTSGNIRLLKEEWWDRWDDGYGSEDFVEDPEILIPAELAVGTIVFEDEFGTEIVTEIGVTVPQNEYGLGPYKNCVVTMETGTWDGEVEVTYSYFAPGIGVVWERWDSEAEATDFRIATVRFDAAPSTPTPTQLPGVTPTPTPGVVPIATPWRVFTFSSSNEFVRYPGGFVGADGGNVSLGVIPQGATGFTDGQGARIVTAPGQLELLLFPTLDASQYMVLVRVSVRSVGTDAVVALAVLDGSMDGSIATNVPADSTGFQDEYGRLVLVYNPPGTTITPIIQVSNLGGDRNALVYLDNLEIYLLPWEGSVSNHLLYGD
ncbi:MAG: hypothetical protein ABIH23_24535 [bacterium]